MSSVLAFSLYIVPLQSSFAKPNTPEAVGECAPTPGVPLFSTLTVSPSPLLASSPPPSSPHPAQVCGVAVHSSPPSHTSSHLCRHILQAISSLLSGERLPLCSPPFTSSLSLQLVALLVVSPPFLLSLLEAQGLGHWFGKTLSFLGVFLVTGVVIVGLSVNAMQILRTLSGVVVLVRCLLLLSLLPSLMTCMLFCVLSLFFFI